MEQTPLKFVSVRLWLLAIIIINGLFYIIYFVANNSGPNFALLWSYMESDVFKLVTGSLMIPLLFSILEKRYKFMENIQKQREEKQKLAEEIRRKNRQDAINDTIRMWQDLYDMTSEVVYLDPQDNKKETYHPLILKLSNFSSSAEHIVNKWTHQFPNLTYKDQDVFLYFINLLFQSGLTAIYLIRDEQNIKEIESVQDTLFQIQDQIKTISNHTITNTFKYSARYLELKESGENPTELKKYGEMIQEQMSILRNWRDSLITLDDDHDNFLSTGTGPQMDDIRKTAKSIEKWLLEDEARFIQDHPDFGLLEQQFNAIPLEERVKVFRIPYSKEYLMALADWLSFQAACNYLYSKRLERS